MAWITLTDKDAASRFAIYEWEAMTATARESGVGDVIQRSIDRVTARVRSYVRSCHQNTLGPDGTIPNELHSAATALLMEDIATNLPASGVIMDEGRRMTVSEAKTELRMVAKCELLVALSDTTSNDTSVIDDGGYGGEEYIDFSVLR
jgi:hypothetical protein